MIVLFPFEKEFYAKHGYTADLVGHPLIDEVRPDKGASEFLKELGLDEKRPVVAFLPGSREQEKSVAQQSMIDAETDLAQKKQDSERAKKLFAGNPGYYRERLSKAYRNARLNSHLRHRLRLLSKMIGKPEDDRKGGKHRRYN